MTSLDQAPHPETTLEHYPWIIVRFRCSRCRRYADSRLARLAERFGATETIAMLVARFHATCPHRPAKHNGRTMIRYEPCGGYCPDLGSTIPPDLPPSLSGLTLIDGGKGDMLPAEPSAPQRRRRVGGDDV
ncbi:MAG: hypothetical protein J0J10_14575 [Bosea sp.]|uniref:hypothetical protein n=1 Tax=Bosea sp. (in: a-proteobacteria) TaxID=1871050 RepID=UPI001AC62E15|nr:hypothetical protein [Bosea sp. (in: a-proteobacteria)]MBN9469988.1 hypothetical protein [Bosea sp. (in: a-proteobacteria)]